MFNKILVANRGEIALRIIRACKEMDIHTVAVYSQIDRDSLHVNLADEAICIGKASPQDSYLNIENIISAAIGTKADAIHPGFGFLSESAKFAKICEECQIKFIGPTSSMIRKMGDKAKAREMMIKAGVPVVPGSDGIVRDVRSAKQLVKKIGYPIIIKAVAGGGGRGMRLVWSETELKNAFLTASQEALTAFGDGSMYIEKYIQNPKHIEFQILGDTFGNIVHIGERDCTMQRRHQKLIEESPSPNMSEDMRKVMGEHAIMAAKAVNYENAGTIEFILDKDNNHYFIEMNTRIQVEHPVTEMVSNIDLIKEQIKIASGEKLKFTQDDIKLRGHAIECRINAENPLLNFRPSAGKITELYLPGGRGVRIESSIYAGYVIPPTYDSMIAKIITWGEDRQEAIAIMKRALSETVVEGVSNNIEFQLDLLYTTAFETGEFNTTYIENNLDQLLGLGGDE
ncbi:acetyl-CoA carboxylase biotin carboxylase subunit [Candidatus Epulonipiscium fishelsonii]|uniref:Acetyl-CoA carboxylase biotin carboxylase subunit n=1 Tax=Candidatus Epulonipiscium fishelsonii TaxID=77094 RepID=A0ACC8XBB6_9FIRM|nr:acetyl-CoA carboxylase biotin carboxylase subunit [Epulopiscium sp. SCG-B11WGA-EpuloA1]ONI41988.1 acetyl-CoA carboxylase biotin carboxylase subunit [Epulopiscium sp. SCG-B05WGA-EpuloA1]